MRVACIMWLKHTTLLYLYLGDTHFKFEPVYRLIMTSAVRWFPSVSQQKCHIFISATTTSFQNLNCSTYTIFVAQLVLLKLRSLNSVVK
jgi:hypothetical protein